MKKISGRYIICPGDQFSRLTALTGSRAAQDRIVCVCSCGSAPKLVRAANLISTKHLTKSCGCLNAENRHVNHRTHGLSNHELYGTWLDMRRRCVNPKNSRYPYYGGRGIYVCERWMYSFPNSLEDMGERPEGMSLDRIDNDGPYDPDNCRWADKHTQNLNQRIPEGNVYYTALQAEIARLTACLESAKISVTA
jgi:hypothetical protein